MAGTIATLARSTVWRQQRAFAAVPSLSTASSLIPSQAHRRATSSRYYSSRASPADYAALRRRVSAPIMSADVSSTSTRISATPSPPPAPVGASASDSEATMAAPEPTIMAKAKSMAKPARRGAAAKAAQSITASVDADGASDSELSDAPELQVVPATTQEEQVTKPAPAKRARKPWTPKAKADPDAAAANGSGSDDGAAPPKKKRARKAKAKAEPAEDTGPIVLHAVQHRDFASEGAAWRRGQAFTGRLGYACLNTILRSAKPAPIFASRTLRLNTLEEQGPSAAHALGRANAADLVPMLEWNAAHGIRFMRLSSEMFPFASHKAHGYSPREVAAEQLKAAGDKARELGIRVTMHPGQFTQLGSPKDEIVEAAVRELTMHCDILDGMGVGPDGVLIVHGGGTYLDRSATLARIAHTITHRLPPHVRARLVLENDELAYSAEELLPLCEELDVPLVFDFHHDLLRPSSQPPSELLPRINAIWARRGIRPKYHLSEARPGAATLRERRAHSDRCLRLPPDLPPDADLMIEAKDKEQAVLELMRIYRLVDESTIERAVRPPAGIKMQGLKGAGKRGVSVKKDYAGGLNKQNAGAAGEDAEGSGAGEDDATASASESGSPTKKKRENQEDMAKRVLRRARELARAKGRTYTGPGAKVDLSDDEGDGSGANGGSALLASEQDASPAAAALRAKRAMDAEQVYQDMLVRAEQIRARLRATGEREKYDGNGIEGQDENGKDDADADAAELLGDEDGEDAAEEASGSAAPSPAKAAAKGNGKKKVSVAKQVKEEQKADEAEQSLGILSGDVCEEDEAAVVK